MLEAPSNMIVVVENEMRREEVIAAIDKPGERTCLGAETTIIVPQKQGDYVSQTTRQIAELRRLHPQRRTVLLIDLHMGNNPYAGIEVAELIKESFLGGVLLVGEEPSKVTHERLKQAGVRMWCGAQGYELGRALWTVLFDLAQERLYHALVPLNLLSSGAAWPVYKHPTPLRPLMWRLWNIGYAYDGTEESVNWDEVTEVERELHLHFHALPTNRPDSSIAVYYGHWVDYWLTELGLVGAAPGHIAYGLRRSINALKDYAIIR